jgi:predicted alpha/beta hydrolase family esterase
VCFECGDPGHYTRNCPKKCPTANLIDFNQTEYEQPTEEDHVARLKAELRQMSNKEKERLA